jgi:hypothetical protein
VLDVELFPGEAAAAAAAKQWTTPSIIAWIFIVCVIIAIIALSIWFLVRICLPSRPKDISARDINGRDIAASGNVTIGGNLTVVAGTTKFSNTIIEALSLPPTSFSGLAVTLDGTLTSIMLTNQSGGIVTVTLPPGAENVGKLIAIYNETTNSVFHVDPQGTDTIEASTATAVENSSALLLSMGVTPAGVADWKQLF